MNLSTDCAIQKRQKVFHNKDVVFLKDQTIENIKEKEQEKTSRNEEPSSDSSNGDDIIVPSL